VRTVVQRREGEVAYRDLNKNGRLDPYEDPRRPLEERVEDLLGRMTLEEKAGLMFHAMAQPDGAEGGVPGLRPAEELVRGERLSHFNVAASAPAGRLAEWHNRLQAEAEATRLGIPVTLSSDPRNGFHRNPAANVAPGGFALWPEPLGLAAIGDPAVTRQHADMARQEYLAVGIRVALHPMADLATEPRWGRIYGTFGEDAELAARLVDAYVRGFQGERLGRESVACMTKHFPGGGSQKDGEDPHFPYGKEQVYPGGQFEYHLRPFEAAFAAGTAQVMPYYGVPVGIGLEEVGFAFNADVIDDLLRRRYGFDGVVCTDWQLLIDRVVAGGLMLARAWGVEQLSPLERVIKVIEAGCDQFGGEQCPELVVEAVRGGLVSAARVDQSVRRLLRDKFRLGLFDDPYVDPVAAERVVGQAAFAAAGAEAQRRSLVLLASAGALPLRGRPRLYLEGVDPAVARAYGQVVASPDEAEVAILRLAAPYEPREGFLERFTHAGDLTFPEPERARILALCARLPTVVDVYLDRAAVLPEIAAAAAGLVANFGATDEALLDMLFGRAPPRGRLPLELPSSMAAVRRQRPDVPRDSERPLFPFGHGLEY
jgi:beta-glucosidase